MKKVLKKQSSARDVVAVGPELEKGKSKKDSKLREELVYQQTPLHAIDDAPSPTTTPVVKTHAVSAADIILSQSLTNLESGSSHHHRTSSGAGAGHKTTSFLLQGSASSLLKGGSTHAAAAAAVPLRRRSQSESSQPMSTQGSSSQGMARSPRTEKEAILKRSIYAPKELSDRGMTKENLVDALKIYDSSGEDEPGKGTGGDASSESSDSYDANLLGTGTDSVDGGKNNGNVNKTINRQASSMSQGRGISVADLSQDSEYDDDDDFPGSASSYDDDDSPIVCSCCGNRIAHIRRCIKVNRIATALVRFAPCFWCFPITVSATDRTVLTRLNIISAFFSLGQVVATSWLVIAMIIPPSEHEQDNGYSLTYGMAPNLWSLTGSMYSVGFFGAIIFVSNLVTLKVIQVVNLVGAIRYLWVLLYMLPFEIFFVIGLIDVYNVTRVWIKHWWLVPSMAWFREYACAPGTAGTLCMVPAFGDDSYYAETEWCLYWYQATNCTEIRNEAQAEVENLMSFYYRANVAWGMFLLFVLFLIVNTLERIISRPMVQKSRESNVPAWLSLPLMACTVVGIVFRYSPSSVLSARSGSTYSWVGTAYITCGALFLCSAGLGWFISTFSILSGRDKRYKHICVIFFIFFNAVTCFVLMIIFGASVSYSVALVDIPINPAQKDDISCGVDTADSCSNCDLHLPDQPTCPEWTLEDVTAVLQTQTKGSATLAVIFFLYSFSALRFGFVLRKHVTMYQIDYV